MNFVRDALKSETNSETLIQQEYVKHSQRFQGARSFQFINDYYIERQQKQGFIEEHVYA